MPRILVFAGLAAGLFVFLGVLEALQGDEPVTLAGLALDFVEKGLLALAVVATAYVSLEARDMRRDRARLLNDLARATAEGERWRAAAKIHVDGLGRAIREQFGAWRLTEGEADIAVLMLKGLSHKEIARLRATSEATVRQQATAVYRKSGLSSRAELAAFFLEDLLPPGEEPGSDGRRGLALVETAG
jgi:DNA-binding CsgD family transcriptional regulator